METKTIDELKPDPKNPRRLSQHDGQALHKSLDRFGDLSCIVFNATTQQLVGGHQRLEIMKRLPAEKKIIITNRYDTPDDVGTVAIGYVFVGNKQFAYREVEWDEGTQHAANIAANRIQGEFDLDMLAELNYELSQLENGAELLALSGQTDKEISQLLDSVGANGENAEEDDAPEVDEKKPPVSKPGEIYQLGQHRLMCGDSTDSEAVSELMDGVKADMVYTDPPYGMSLDVDYDSMFKNDDSHKDKGDRFTKVIADDDYFDPSMILSMFSTTKEIFLWGADYFYDSLPRGGSMSAWDKRTENLDAVVGNTTEFLWSKQPHRRMTARILWSGHHGMGEDDDKKRMHPTQKPVKLHKWFFDNYGSNHKNIVDLFGGSGSTLIACDKLDRTCYMMELDNRYIDVIIKRWQKHSGQEAVRISDGKTWNQLSQENLTAPKTENTTADTTS